MVLLLEYKFHFYNFFLYIYFSENLAIIADTNCVKISKSLSHSIFYENSDTKNFIRDCGWLSSTELLTISFEGKLRCHKVQ